MTDYLLSPEEREHYQHVEKVGMDTQDVWWEIDGLLEAQHKKTTAFWNDRCTEHPIPDGQVIGDGNKIPHYHDGEHWYYTHRRDCSECRKIMEE